MPNPDREEPQKIAKVLATGLPKFRREVRSLRDSETPGEARSLPLAAQYGRGSRRLQTLADGRGSVAAGVVISE